MWLLQCRWPPFSTLVSASWLEIPTIQKVLQVIVGRNPPGFQKFVLSDQVPQSSNAWFGNVDFLQFTCLILLRQPRGIIIVRFISNRPLPRGDHCHGVDALGPE